MNWTPPGELPIVCGHRGAPTVAPENTLAGFAAAAARGATWIEFDVRPTRDAVLSIHHDPVTARGRRISSTDFVELDPAIPCFADLISAVPQLGLDIEMKTDDVDMSPESFAELVIHEIDTHYAGRTDLIVTSFDAQALRCVRDRRADIATGVLFSGRSATAIDAALRCAIDDGHVAIAPWIRILDAPMVDRARRASLAILTWTVNEVAHVVAAANLGVDVIIGDDPMLIADNL